jgi:predicted O-methyltransferase YrrM
MYRDTVTDAASPTYTILIPTLGERARSFDALMQCLMPQVDAYTGRVKVLAWWNNGAPGLPEIRQCMVEAVTTDYLSFIDDDDMVPEDFVSSIMTALESRPDYVGFQVRYYSGGRDHGSVYHSLQFGEWREEHNPYRLLRDISHVNPMRSDAAKAADFTVVGRGVLEDRPWVDQVRNSGMLKTEVYLERDMYEYWWDRRVTRWRQPNRIRQVRTRSNVNSPHFTWQDQVHAGMVENREQRIPQPEHAERSGDRGLGGQLQAQGVLPERLGGLRPEGDLGQRSSRGRRSTETRSGVRSQHALTEHGTITAERLAVIVPTRGRPENIRKVIAAWDETDAWAAADLLLAADADDPEIEGYRQVLRGRDEISLYLIDEWTPMVPKLNRAAVATAETRLYFAIAFAGDDHLSRTPGWAQAYLRALHGLGTGMVYGDDGYQGRKLSTEWAVTADVVRELGRMVPAPVDHLYCDNAMMMLFEGAGALRHLPDVRIEHMHPVAGKASSDAQYEKVNSAAQYRGDRAAFETWKRTALPSQIEIIRKLRGEVASSAPVRPARERTSRMRGSGPRPIQRSGPSRYSAPPKSKYPFPPEFRWVVGATPDDIAFTLADFAASVPADQEIVELGVYQARTALIMAWGASQGNGAHVTAVDAWDLPGNTYHPPFTDAATREKAYANVLNLGYAERIELIQGFAAETGSEVWPCSDFLKPVGLLFVDDDHSAEGVHAAFSAWSPHLAEGAVIAFDDYGHPDWPGVKQAVDELVDNGAIEPVDVRFDRLAVTRLAAPNTDRKITAITSEGVQVELKTDDLGDKTAMELREIAEGLGFKVKPGTKKADVIEAIRAARA